MTAAEGGAATPPLMRRRLPDRHTWWRIARPDWSDPLDPGFAEREGGRWNPPGSFPALYLNEDVMTARLNFVALTARWPYHPEELSDAAGPLLLGCVLPARQVVCDAFTPEGLAAAGLPGSYPLDEEGAAVPHSRCQSVGARARGCGLRGVHARSAQTMNTAKPAAYRELAWFPASPRSVARSTGTLPFSDWYYGPPAAR